MKVHYINILLFALPLNILEHNKNEPHTTPHHPPNTRLLCECELYSPANYDSDPEMKRVMQQFVDRTTQRFHEYDERMKTTRQKCKDKCDKEIQNIILKDKLEKQMEQQLTTLETKIDTNDIPTCVCEKSLADKTEKFCLNCGVQLGGGVLQASGLLGGIGQLGLDAWKAAALVTAKELAEKAGAAKGLAEGNAHGMKIVIHHLKELHIDKLVPGICEKISSTGHYANITNFANTIIQQRGTMCGASGKNLGKDMCTKISIKLGTLKPDGIRPGLPDKDAVTKVLNGLVEQADKAAAHVTKTTSESVTAAIKARETALIEGRFESSITSINASIIAIIVIVLIMVIIYLILRYRRKKKMKKKLQYIKLLEE
ncbi:rifin [Plasmodium falciparum NF54]|uniref:Rifin n=2 Tax=Plasmodium falciparum TaxID=5833 RepID=O96112_PLAF7|nr:rifin [Plasmodium falciparum 3D7]EWC90916.1 hypothetical protein PFNF54_00160 [Plasmodium falciparum NF54]KAF4331453.1 rifin [Plasmodium falciparum NF54]PKC46456.1 rifin [Plasmodium falciparum NF54]CZT98017.1 rifin [Plasmodium falciparum 3D7]|eukprot:XP_001349519.1 rifin [Plasmodium falciparum 3D7]